MDTMKILGGLADLLRDAEARLERLEARQAELEGLGQRDGETIEDVVNRGGLVPRLPSLIEEQRREGSRPAYRLVFPQVDGRRVRLYLGVDGKELGERVVSLREEYERVVRAVRSHRMALGRVHWSVREAIEELDRVRRGGND